VAEQRGELVVVVKETGHFSGAIDASHTHGEGVCFGDVDPYDLNLPQIWRELCQHAVRDRVRVGGVVVIVDDVIVLFQPFRFDNPRFISCCSSKMRAIAGARSTAETEHGCWARAASPNRTRKKNRAADEGVCTRAVWKDK